MNPNHPTELALAAQQKTPPPGVRTETVWVTEDGERHETEGAALAHLRTFEGRQRVDDFLGSRAPPIVDGRARSRARNLLLEYEEWRSK